MNENFILFMSFRDFGSQNFVVIYFLYENNTGIERLAIEAQHNSLHKPLFKVTEM